MQMLDPKLDVVFKMFFADPRNRHLLISLLTAVLRPRSPIVDVTVENPDLPKDLAADRTVRLDVLVKLADGTLVDVEMECDARRGHGNRWLYHWARAYGGQLRRGDEYDALQPVVCIVFLDARTTAQRFHAHYEVREVHDQRRLSDRLAIHVVELPRAAQAAEEDEALQRWARFLRASDSSALDSLASEAPIMAEAKHALEILSLEPDAQRIAEMRREAALIRRLERAEDLAEGRAEGLALGLRTSIVAICSSLGIEVTEGRRQRLESASSDELQALLDAILARRAWPE